MPDVLAELEAKLAQLQTDLAPLKAAEDAALADAAAKTKARLAHDGQIAATIAAQVAAKARLFVTNEVGAVEADAGKVVGAVETDAGKAWKWLISHSWVGALAGVAGYGVKWMGWL